jgi:hypothetical protein
MAEGPLIDKDAFIVRSIEINVSTYYVVLAIMSGIAAIHDNIETYANSFSSIT